MILFCRNLSVTVSKEMNLFLENRGVPRGLIFGSFLFIIYINNLPSCVKEAEITMYADDTSLCKALRTAQDIAIRRAYIAFSKICELAKNE